MAGIQAGTSSLAEAMRYQDEQDTKNQSDIMKMYKDVFKEKESTEDIYKDSLEDSGKEEAQKDFNQKKAQLDALIAEGEQASLQLEQDAGGRGVTSTFLGRRQQEVQRQTAIKALPMKAALEASLGNLEAATEHMNTLFEIRSKDQAAEFEYKVKLVDSVASFMTESQKKKMDFILAAEERKYKEKIDQQGNIQELAINALEDGAPASVISKITAATNLNDAIKARSSWKAPVKRSDMSEGDKDTENAQTVKTKLMGNRGTDGYVDPYYYAELRADSRLTPSQFDDKFGYLVNPISKAKFNVGTSATIENKNIEGAGVDGLKQKYGVSSVEELLNLDLPIDDLLIIRQSI
jgi:hypothetical protein